MRVLKTGGTFLLAVPDMRYTDDCNRPPTTLEHLLNDERDGGGGTRLQAYEEHVRFVHTRSNPPFSEQQVLIEAKKISDIGMDIHYHAWTGASFCEMLAEIKDRLGFHLLHHVSVRNENIYVLEKT